VDRIRDLGAKEDARAVWIRHGAERSIAEGKEDSVLATIGFGTLNAICLEPNG